MNSFYDWNKLVQQFIGGRLNSQNPLSRPAPDTERRLRYLHDVQVFIFLMKKKKTPIPSCRANTMTTAPVPRDPTRIFIIYAQRCSNYTSTVAIYRCNNETAVPILIRVSVGRTQSTVLLSSRETDPTQQSTFGRRRVLNLGRGDYK